jgi:hypothetical protein
LTRLQQDVEPRGLLVDVGRLAEGNRGASGKPLMGIAQTDPVGTDVDGGCRRFRCAGFDLEDVGKVVAKLELDANVLMGIGVVVEDDVLVDAIGHEAVTADRDRRIQSNTRRPQRPEDARRVIVGRP